jgi:hypothetical protein
MYTSQIKFISNSNAIKQESEPTVVRCESHIVPNSISQSPTITAARGRYHSHIDWCACCPQSRHIPQLATSKLQKRNPDLHLKCLNMCTVHGKSNGGDKIGNVHYNVLVEYLYCICYSLAIITVNYKLFHTTFNNNICTDFARNKQSIKSSHIQN